MHSSDYDFTRLFDYSEPLSELSKPSSELCHVAIMIATKNGPMTTATTTRTTGQKAQEPGDFVDTDQMFCLKLSRALIFF